MDSKPKFKLDPMSLLLPHERAAMAKQQQPPPNPPTHQQSYPPLHQHSHQTHHPHYAHNHHHHHHHPHAHQKLTPGVAAVSATGQFSVPHPHAATTANSPRPTAPQQIRPGPLNTQQHFMPVPPGPEAPLSPPASLMSTPPSTWDASSSWGGVGAMDSASAEARQASRAASSSSVLPSVHVQQQQHQLFSHSQPGRARLQDWEIVETLGTGTFGRVVLVRQRPSYRPTSYHPIFPHLYQSLDPTAPSPSATQQVDGQLPHFAMKVLRKSEIVRLKQVEHINSERRILEKVRHPFIVELYATYQDNLNVYMLLSYVPGGELFSHLRRAGRFSADVTRFYLASIVLAIEYLHSNNIIYRDLKPENLLLDRSGYLRIADFGFAKVVEDRTFTLCGTPEYLAPEIVLSQGHGKAVDWWALGILAFEMLAGYPPFFDDHPLGIYEKILRNEVAFPSHVDPYAKDLIRGLLTADRSKRLGNLRGGARDVMNHAWFAGVDWGSLERKEIGAPIVPRVASMSDSQNFQRYPPPRPTELPGVFGAAYDATEDPYEAMFRDFSFPTSQQEEAMVDDV